MKIIVSPVDYNHDETAIIFYCRAKDREDYMRVYGIFDTEQFEIIESRITDITIFRKMVENLTILDLKMKNIKKIILILILILLSSCATTKFNLMVGPTGEEQKTYIENIKQYK